jgi:hypothetical protein
MLNVEVPSQVLETWPLGFFIRAGEETSARYPVGALLLVDPAMRPENNEVGLFEVEGERLCRVVLRGTTTVVLMSDSVGEDLPDVVSRRDEPPVRCLGAIVWYMAPPPRKKEAPSA